MSKSFIISKLSSSLKSEEHSLDSVLKIALVGGILSFLKGIYCSANTLLKIFAFVVISVTNLYFTERGQIMRTFFSF